MPLTKRVRIPFDSPLYPLPSDYESLTEEGKRQARVNACRQWYIVPPTDKAGRAKALVDGLRFFDRVYLQEERDAEGDVLFDSNFYGGAFVESPPYHDLMLAAIAKYRLNAWVAPRGAAKSVLLAKYMTMCAVSQPSWTCTYFTSSQDMATTSALRVREQCYGNPRVQMDFGPEADRYEKGKGWTLKPKKGEMLTGTYGFQLLNNSQLSFRSVTGRKRGGRPKVCIVDDPEWDPNASTDMVSLRAHTMETLDRVLLPMVQHRHTKMLWVGTFVSKRHLLWHIMDTEKVVVDGKEVVRAVDSKFDRWYRVVVPASWRDKDGRRRSFWPHMHPADAEEAERYGIDIKRDEVQTLEMVEREIGSAAYQAEYEANPSASEARFFPELSKEEHGWWLENGDPVEPWRGGTMCWYRRVGGGKETVRMPVKEFMERFPRVVLADTSYKSTKDADYKTGCVMAVTDKNERFVLDGWSAQCERVEQVRQLFALARKWRASTIAPEAIGGGLSLCEDLEAAVGFRDPGMTGDYFPGVRRLNPGTADKASKIMSLQPFFEMGLMKLPWDRMWDGFFARLKEQVLGFSPYAGDGGLKHDDELDTVQMHRLVFKGKPLAPQEWDGDERKELSAKERLMRGERRDEFGMPLVTVAWNELTLGDILDIVGSGKDGGTNVYHEETRPWLNMTTG